MKSLALPSYVLAAATVVLATPLAKRAGTVYTSCIHSNQVALTFDDGPWIYEQSIADTLAKAGAQGTFFVNGNNFACIYDQPQVTSMLYTLSKGHEFGSHTWSHADLTSLSSKAIDTELTRIDDALVKILGLSPALMRPPYGSYNDAVLTVASAHNLSLVMWDFDSGDSVGDTAAQSEQAYSDVAKQHPSNLLALNHETKEPTAKEVLEYALQVFGGEGYQFVTVSQCLGISAYKSQRSPGTRDSTWTCD